MLPEELCTGLGGKLREKTMFGVKTYVCEVDGKTITITHERLGRFGYYDLSIELPGEAELHIEAPTDVTVDCSGNKCIVGGITIVKKDDRFFVIV